MSNKNSKATTFYKLWVHLEELGTDVDGNELEPISRDDLALPQQAGIYPDSLTAINVMQSISNEFDADVR